MERTPEALAHIARMERLNALGAELAESMHDQFTEARTILQGLSAHVSQTASPEERRTNPYHRLHHEVGGLLAGIEGHIKTARIDLAKRVIDSFLLRIDANEGAIAEENLRPSALLNRMLATISDFQSLHPELAATGKQRG